MPRRCAVSGDERALTFQRRHARAVGESSVAKAARTRAQARGVRMSAAVTPWPRSPWTRADMGNEKKHELHGRALALIPIVGEFCACLEGHVSETTTTLPGWNLLWIPSRPSERRSSCFQDAITPCHEQHAEVYQHGGHQRPPRQQLAGAHVCSTSSQQPEIGRSCHCGKIPVRPRIDATAIEWQAARLHCNSLDKARRDRCSKGTCGMACVPASAFGSWSHAVCLCLRSQHYQAESAALVLRPTRNIVRIDNSQPLASFMPTTTISLMKLSRR